MSVAIPRIRDFRGLRPRSFDGRGNYKLGIREQIIFPEIDYDADRPGPRPRRHDHDERADRRGGYALLEAFGMPFSREGNPYIQTRGSRLDGQDLPARPQARPAKYKTREYTRCRRCGRARSVYRKFGLCRICLRELAHDGYIPGMTKSSW